MELKQLQDQITGIFLTDLKSYKVHVSDDYLVLKISEELGEFVQSYIVHKKMCRPEKYVSTDESKKLMAKELADVVGLVFAISTELQIDLEEALTKKWITKEWVKRKSAS